MGFFKKLTSVFSSSPQKPADLSYWYTVRCKRCGEEIKARIDLRNDLTIDYDTGGDSYFCRKVIMGAGYCFQQIEVQMRFNSKRQLSDRQITGGEFLD
jgi:hypothetical protein